MVIVRTLVVQKLFSGLGSVLGVGRLNDGVDGARLLAETAVNALGHVDIVLGGSAGSISSLLSLDGDGLGGADLQNSCQRYWTAAVWGIQVIVQPRRACKRYNALRQRGIVGERARHGIGER